MVIHTVCNHNLYVAWAGLNWEHCLISPSFTPLPPPHTSSSSSSFLISPSPHTITLYKSALKAIVLYLRFTRTSALAWIYSPFPGNNA